MTLNDTTFADLGVADDITSALAAAGIINPFPIQEMAIPLTLSGVDLIGQARTGTGKTLAFGISLVQRVTPGEHKEPRALVVCPTRELALQVTKDIALAGSNRGVKVLTVYGGVGYDPQLEALATGVDIVVGTPGRLLDLMQRKALNLGRVQTLVLDEADEMLDLGFLPDVERLIPQTHPDRQVLLFSATMPAAVLSLARNYLRQPLNIRAESHSSATITPNTTQYVYQTHSLDKPEIIARVLQSEDVEKVIVFTKTKRAAQRLTDDLIERGFNVGALHGDLNQQARERALKKFRAGTIPTLVATDVAARGIDVSGVSHVINHEAPDDDLTYVHRIGRTGRAGNTGIAVTLVDWADLTKWRLINRALNLDFADPIETYSTSPNLLEDLKIPAGTKGRIGDPEPKAPSGRSSDPDAPRPRSRREAGTSRHGKEDSGEHKPRRRRRSSGSANRAEGARDEAGQPKDSASQQHTEAPSGRTSENGEGGAPRRRRRRRRSSGSGEGQNAQNQGTQNQGTQNQGARDQGTQNRGPQGQGARGQSDND